MRSRLAKSIVVFFATAALGATTTALGHENAADHLVLPAPEIPSCVTISETLTSIDESIAEIQIGLAEDVQRWGQWGENRTYEFLHLLASRSGYVTLSWQLRCK